MDERYTTWYRYGGRCGWSAADCALEKRRMHTGSNIRSSLRRHRKRTRNRRCLKHLLKKQKVITACFFINSTQHTMSYSVVHNCALQNVRTETFMTAFNDSSN